MEFTRISEQQAWDALAARNREFHAGTFAVPALYTLLEREGIDHRGCVLSLLFPDDAGCLVGVLMGPGPRLLEFELYPENPEASFLEERDLPRRPTREFTLALRLYQQLAESPAEG